MNTTEIKALLNKLADNIAHITDVKVVATFNILINLVELLADENFALKEEVQKLNDEIKRLKGEQGKPDIRPQTLAPLDNTNHSSEADRNKRRSKKKRKAKMKKKKKIKIDKRVTVQIDMSILPDDAMFKGYQTRIIQDIKIITNNIEFSLAVYYSPSLKKTFLADMPAGYVGEFGPGVRALVLTLYRDSGMTQPAIKRFLNTFDIYIANSTISRMITENHDQFHQEKEDIIDAGLESTQYQHLDDTGSRVNGKNHYTHILCNPYFTAFFTQLHKDRLTILKLLCRGELKFDFNNIAYELMVELGLSNKRLAELKAIAQEGTITSNELNDILAKMFPNPKKHRTSKRIIREAAAIVYYKASEYAIEFLMSDDAPQFNKIAKYKALCWIHEGRHYKKLSPLLTAHQDKVDDFIEQFWDYYEALLAYKQQPSAEVAKKLSTEFDVLFSTVTGYDALDQRIASTKAKKESLLLVLTFTFLPLHNNSAELGARAQARMRDINLQTISANGTKSKDTFLTIVQTARKLGVNIYDYIHDRVSKKFAMPSLAELIMQQSSLALGSA